MLGNNKPANDTETKFVRNQTQVSKVPITRIQAYFLVKNIGKIGILELYRIFMSEL